jgi:adenylate cyclase
VAKEIERKYLVTGEEWRREAGPGVAYRQGYLANNERCSVRVRLGDDGARLNVKSATLGVSREEYEYALPEPDARAMLETLCERPVIEKTRYVVPHGGHRWEVDVFEGANAGLVVAEIELGDEAEQVPLPPWVGAEVTDDPRYYNVNLVANPFRDW